MAAGIKKGDVVVVIAGDAKHDPDDKKTGKVLHVDHQKHRVIVEGIRVRKIARKRKASGTQSGIVEKECPIHISNVMLKQKYDERQNKRKKK